MATYYTALETLHDRLLTARSDGSFSVADRLENRLNEIYGYYWRYTLAYNTGDSDGQDAALAGLIAEFALEDITVPITEVLQSLAVFLQPTTNYIPIPTDSDGNDGVFTNATFDVTVWNNGVDDTSNWTLARVDNNTTSTLVSNTVTISAISANTGYIDVTATRTGYNSLSIRVQVTKVKNGATGATGATGTLNASSEINLLAPSGAANKRIISVTASASNNVATIVTLLDNVGSVPGEYFTGTLKIKGIGYEDRTDPLSLYFYEYDYDFYVSSLSVPTISAKREIHESKGASVSTIDARLSATGSTIQAIFTIGVGQSADFHATVQLDGLYTVLT